MHKRHAEEVRSLDGECKAQSDFEREVETREKEWVKMNLERRRLGLQAAEIKKAIMAGDQKLVHSSYIFVMCTFASQFDFFHFHLFSTPCQLYLLIINYCGVAQCGEMLVLHYYRVLREEQELESSDMYQQELLVKRKEAWNDERAHLAADLARLEDKLKTTNDGIQFRKQS